jgi:hypothetical protein
MTDIKYAYWRDKEAETGFSKELISEDFKFIKDVTNEDDLLAWPFDNVDTVYKALYRNVEKYPNNEFLGTRNGDHYEWLSFKEALSLAENLSYGFKSLGMIPEI